MKEKRDRGERKRGGRRGKKRKSKEKKAGGTVDVLCDVVRSLRLRLLRPARLRSNLRALRTTQR